MGFRKKIFQFTTEEKCEVLFLNQLFEMRLQNSKFKNYTL